MKDRLIYQNIFDKYKESKQQEQKPEPKKLLNEIACGIMGMGTLGVPDDNIPFDEGPDDHTRFSDDVLNMTLRDLFNQVKGTDEGLYRKLIYYVHDKMHDTPSYDDEIDSMYDSPCSTPEDSFKSPISAIMKSSISEEPFSDMGPGEPVKRIIIRRESKKTSKKPDTDLLIESIKALKSIRK